MLNVFFIVPSGIPQDVSLNNVTPYSISLMWTPPPPSQQNGAIVGYIVNLTHANTLETIQYYSIVTNVAITGLDPYTTYICVVAAETTIGVGPFSQLFFEKTKEAGNHFSVIKNISNLLQSFTSTRQSSSTSQCCSS